MPVGAMDVESAWNVFMNYLNMMKHNPTYFEKAHPPAKLDVTFQQQVHAMLEHRDQYGRRVYVFRPGVYP